MNLPSNVIITVSTLSKMFQVKFLFFRHSRHIVHHTDLVDQPDLVTSDLITLHTFDSEQVQKKIANKLG